MALIPLLRFIYSLWPSRPPTHTAWLRQCIVATYLTTYTVIFVVTSLCTWVCYGGHLLSWAKRLVGVAFSAVRFTGQFYLILFYTSCASHRSTVGEINISSAEITVSYSWLW